MSGSGAEAGTATFKVMVGSEHSIYPMDKSGACSIRGGGIYRDGVIGGRGRGVVG